MSTRRLHKLLGLMLLAPLMAWGATGLVFYFKPGYAGAYAQLSPKFYPLAAGQVIVAQANWRQVRWLNTLLGQHALVQIDGAWQHLDANTLEPFAKPSQAELLRFVQDAITVDPARYGEVVTLAQDEALTSTGIRIHIDWPNLRLQQRGPDTDLIDTLYDIHYLRWTTIKPLDQALGLMGIALLFGLTGLGVFLSLRSRRPAAR